MDSNPSISEMPIIRPKSLRLPPPTYKVVTEPGYRVPQTRTILDKVKFTGDEADFLFDLYGKQTVLQGIAAYVASPSNAHREANLNNPWEIQRGLVATIESIRTRGIGATQNDIIGGADIVDVMSARYQIREPTLRLRNEGDAYRLALLKHFVGVFLKDYNQSQPVTMH